MTSEYEQTDTAVENTIPLRRWAHIGGRRLHGSDRLLLAVLSGVCIFAAAPPFDVWPLAFVALIPLYFAVRGASVAKAALPSSESAPDFVSARTSVRNIVGWDSHSASAT